MRCAHAYRGLCLRHKHRPRGSALKARRTHARAATAVAAVLAAGCGTTVSLPPGAQPGESGATAGEAALGVGSESTSSGIGGSGAGGQNAQPPTDGSSVTAASRPGSAPALGVVGSGAARAGVGPGWDTKHVYVGIITASDASNALHALGISLDPGDEIGDAKAIVAGINARGGLFGRQVALVDKDDRSADVLANASSAGEADCTYFAQDHHVISVVNTDASLDLDSFRACFAKARIPLVTLTTSAFDDQTGRNLAPDFYNALSVSWTRLTPLLVNRLSAEGYFSGWNTSTGQPSSVAKAKVGVLYGEDTAGRRDGPALVAALRRAGYATDQFQYAQDNDASSAVLRFAADGVTHVIGIDNFQFFFMTAARSQNYLPRYGVTSYNAPEALLESNGNPAQLNGALGVGWYPTIDTDAGHDPGSGPGAPSCLADLAKGGQTFAGRRFAEAVGLAICDGLHLAVVGAKAGGGLDPSSIREGIVAEGPHFPAAGGFSSGLSATNYAMPGSGRDLGWDPGCTCFSYRGSAYRI